MNKRKFTILILFMIIYNGAAIAFSLSFQRVVDTLQRLEENKFYTSLMFMLVVFITQLVSYHIYTRIKNSFIKEKVIQLKLNLYQSIFRFTIPAFKKSDSSEYVSFLFNDINRYEDSYMELKIDSIEKAILGILAIAGILYIYPLFILVVLGMTLFAVVIPLVLIRKAKDASARISKAYEDATSKTYEMFEGFQVIKFFRYEKKAVQECLDTIVQMENEKCRLKNYMILVQCVLMSLTNALIVITFVIGGRLVFRNIFTLGTIIALVQLLVNVTNPILGVISNYNQIQSVHNIKEKADEIMHQQTKTEQKTKKKDFVNSIELKHITYKYMGNTYDTIKDFSFTFQKNKKYAIVGKNGCGKSTLLKLLVNYYDDYEGDILHDGMNVKDVDDQYIYDNIAFVSQDIFLFHKTIQENILIHDNIDNRKCDLLMKEFEIAEIAKKHSLGSNYNINRVTAVSGGEKQRIVLTREMLKNYKILIADEADSALDVNAAHKIFQTINKLDPQTYIFITHKIDYNLNQYDEIIVMDNGTLVESGTYQQLIRRKGYFYNELLQHKEEKSFLLPATS